MMRLFRFCSIIFILCAIYAQAQEPVGLFDGYTDIGDVGLEGAAALSGSTYQLETSGSGFDDFSDSGFFVYKRLSGNFSIEGITFLLGGGQGGLMIRQDLEADSPFAAYVQQSNGNVYPLFRTLRGEAMTDDGFVSADSLLDGTIRLERVGNTIRFYTLDLNEQWALQQTEHIELSDPVYVGLAVTAGNNDNLELFDVESVKIEEYPFSVERRFNPATPEQGAALTVTLAAHAASVSSATVSEVIPSGASVSDISVSAGEFVQTENGDIEWTLTDLTGDAELTYTIDPPDRPVVIWNGSFTDGTHDGYIGGRMFTAPSNGFQPHGVLSVHPQIPRFIEAEWGEQTGGVRTFGLQFDPRSESGFLVTAAEGSSSAILDGVLEYTLDVQETGTYYIFAQCRRENDQSDSLFIGFDSIDATDEYAYPLTGSRDPVRRWWYTFNEGGRFWETTTEIRPFELTEGQHTLYIAPRETNAEIDWLVITSDPNLAIGNFEPREAFFIVSRSLPSTGSTLPESVDVSLSAGVVKNSALDLRVEETIPKGWTAANINAAAGSFDVDANKIVWNVSGLNQDAELTYSAIPAADAVLGIFSGRAYDLKSGESQPVFGKYLVPDVIPFQIRTEPIDVSPTSTTFIQAEAVHAHSGDFIVQADDSLVSLLYAMPTSSGRSGGVMNDQELTFELNVLESSVYYLFANVRAESDQTDSYYIGFDVDFVGMSDSADNDRYGFVVPSRGTFEKIWNRLFVDGQRFWVLTDELRPHELTAGAHTLHWHSREPETKVDWIAITPDPTLNLTTVIEPGETPDSAVTDFMLY
ncbi:MAG: hypothetical protein GC154_20595 [bacterium]|nr:hypothetical protein [bacterium]